LKYEKPIIEIQMLETQDIITTSGDLEIGVGGGDNFDPTQG